MPRLAASFPTVIPILALGSLLPAQTVPYKGTLVRHDVTLRITRACPSTQVTIENATFNDPARSQYFIFNPYSCSAVEFSGPLDISGERPHASHGAVSFKLPSMAVKSRFKLNDSFVTIDPTTRLDVEASFTGTATIESPGVREHNFWTDIKITELPDGVSCPVAAVEKSIKANQTGSVDMAASTKCAVGGLRIVRVIGASTPPAEFEASVVFNFTIDSGHIGVRCCSEQGGKADVTVRSIFLFKPDVGDLPGQKSDGVPKIKPVVPESDPQGFRTTSASASPYLSFGAYTTSLVEEGRGLDTGCRFGSDGDLMIQVPVRRYVGETESDGRLKDWRSLVDRGVVAEYAVLSIAAYDVDHAAALSPDRKPETDSVYVNGERLMKRTEPNQAVQLKGFNNQWSVTRFLVPVRMLKFPTAPRSLLGPAAAANEIRISVDVDNTAHDQWCTEVDWVTLSVAAMAPIILVHGMGDDSSTWRVAAPPQGIGRSPASELERQSIPYDLADVSSYGSAERNAFQLREQVVATTTRFGANSVHIVGHGKGATDARAMISRHNGRVRLFNLESTEVQILSLFAVGTPSKGTVRYDIPQFGRQLASRLGSTAYAPIRALDSLGQEALTGVLHLVGVGSTIEGVLNGVNEVGNKAENLVKDLFGRLHEDVQNYVFYAFVSDTTAPKGSALMSVQGMAAFNAKTPKPPGVLYYSIGGTTDQNGNRTVDLLTEVDGFFLESPFGFQSLTLDAARIAAADFLYQVLGKYSQVAVVDRKFLGVAEYADFVASTSSSFLDNDLLTTVESVHCASPCGFVPLATLPRNHYALKSPQTMDIVLETIRRDFPLPR